MAKRSELRESLAARVFDWLLVPKHRWRTVGTRRNGGLIVQAIGDLWLKPRRSQKSRDGFNPGNSDRLGDAFP